MTASGSDRPPVIAVANSNPDIVELLRWTLEQDAMVTVGAHLHEIRTGNTDFIQFLREHDPTVVLFDIPPPYDANWTFVQMLCALPEMRRRGRVFTTTNKPHLDRLVGDATAALEIVGKPNDLRDVVEAVKREVERVRKLRERDVD